VKPRLRACMSGTDAIVFPAQRGGGGWSAIPPPIEGNGDATLPRGGFCRLATGRQLRHGGTTPRYGGKQARKKKQTTQRGVSAA